MAWVHTHSPALIRWGAISHGVQTPTEHPSALGPQEAPTAAQGRTSRVHRPQGDGGRTPRDHRRSGRDSTELRPQTCLFCARGPRGGGAAEDSGVAGRGAEVLQSRSVVQRTGGAAPRIPGPPQKGHDFFASQASENECSAISQSRAPAPRRRRCLCSLTALVRNTPEQAADIASRLPDAVQEQRQRNSVRGRAAENHSRRAGVWALCSISWC